MKARSQTQKRPSLSTVRSPSKKNPPRPQVSTRVARLDLKNKQLLAACERYKEAARAQALLVERAPVGLLRLDRRGTILGLNRAAAALLGRDKTRLLGAGFGSLLRAEEGQKFKAHLRRCAQTVHAVTSEFRMPNQRGGVLILQCQSQPVRDARQRLLELENTLIDVTAQSQAQTALSESERHLRALIEASPHPIQLLDAEGRWQMANRAALEMFGLSGVEYRHKRYADLAVHSPFYREALTARQLRHLAAMSARAARRNDETIPKPDGSARVFDTIRVPLLGRDGQINGLVVLGYDLTERKESETAVRENDELMRLILETAMDAVVVFDRHAVITHWNSEAERLFGWNRVEAIGKILNDTIIPAQPRAGPWNALRHFFTNPNAAKAKQRLEATARHRDGREFPVELAITPTTRGDEIWFSAFIRDISERKQAERRAVANLAISRILATSADLDDAAPKLLGTIGELLGFQYGALWVPENETEVLRCQSVWQAPNAGLATFEEASRDATFAPGVGLPGRIWAHRKPVWVRDITQEENFPRAPVAAAEGLHTGFGFPIVRNQSVLGVMEFFSREQREADEVFLGAIHAIADQIGQFLERQQGEAALRESEALIRLARDQLANANNELDRRVRDRTAELSQANAALEAEMLARNQAEHARLRLAAIVESSSDAIVGRNLDGLITSWNKAAAEMFGWTAAEILGRPFELLVPPEHRRDLQALNERLKGGESAENIEAARLRKDGRLLEVSITHSPVRDDTGAIVGMAAIIRDIGERKRLQAEVLGISEREQRRIAQDLHDGLGQQLVGIFCLSDVLKKNLSDQASPVAEEAARISRLLHAAVAQTRGLARGLLPVAPEPGGLMAALGEMADHLTNLFKIRCHFDCPQPIMVEDGIVADNLFRIAQEAATNAIKHARAQDIAIELSATPERMTLAVRDDGVGLPKTARGSKGLGLRIMNHRAGVIGGTLVVQKQNGGGTEVLCTLELPRTQDRGGVEDEPQRVAMAEPPPQPNRNRKPRTAAVSETSRSA